MKDALKKAFTDNPAFNEEQHIECSAKEGDNITDAFYKVIETF